MLSPRLDPNLAHWLANAPRHGTPGRPRFRPAGPELENVNNLALRRPDGSELPCRRYRSRPVPSEGTPPGITVVYIHGGSFIGGDLDTHDRACRRIALSTEYEVLALDYRRAPEHPAPAALDDVLLACRGITDAGGIPALSGDSAGGLIALLAARLLLAEGARLAPLLLITPNADLTLSLPSVEEFGFGWGLDAEELRGNIASWLPSRSPRALARFSPLQARFPPLPTVLLGRAGYDPLVDEGQALAERLRAQGTVVHDRLFPTLLHGFVNFDALSPAARAAGDTLFTEFAGLLRRESPDIHSTSSCTIFPQFH